MLKWTAGLASKLPAEWVAAMQAAFDKVEGDELMDMKEKPLQRMLRREGIDDAATAASRILSLRDEAQQGSQSQGNVSVGQIRYNELSDRLGQGRFGFVFRCTLTGSSLCLAVKQVPRLRFEAEGGKKEIDVLLHAQATDNEGHPNVIRYHLMAANEHSVYIVMGLCDESLEERVQRRGLECWEARKATCSQLCAGLAYLHTLPQPIAHRDLKPSNLLFKGNCLKMYACMHLCVHICVCMYRCLAEPTWARAASLRWARQQCGLDRRVEHGDG